MLSGTHKSKYVEQQPQLTQNTLVQQKLKLSQIMGIWQSSYQGQQNDDVQFNLVLCDCQTEYNVHRQYRLMIEYTNNQEHYNNEISYQNHYDNQFERFFKNKQSSKNLNINHETKYGYNLNVSDQRNAYLNKNKLITANNNNLNADEQIPQRNTINKPPNKQILQKRSTDEANHQYNYNASEIESSAKYYESFDQQIRSLILELQKFQIDDTILAKYDNRSQIDQQFKSFKQNIFEKLEIKFDQASNQQEQLALLRQAYNFLMQQSQYIINNAPKYSNSQQNDKYQDQDIEFLQLETNFEGKHNFSFNGNEASYDELQRQNQLKDKNNEGSFQNILHASIQKNNQISQDIKKSSGNIMKNVFEVVESEVYKGTSQIHKKLPLIRQSMRQSIEINKSLKSSIKIKQSVHQHLDQQKYHQIQNKMPLLKHQQHKLNMLRSKNEGQIKQMQQQKNIITIHQLKIRHLQDRKTPIRVVKLLSPYR